MIAAAPASERAGEELDAEPEMGRSAADRAGELPVVSDHGPVPRDAGFRSGGGARLGAAEEVIAWMFGSFAWRRRRRADRCAWRRAGGMSRSFLQHAWPSICSRHHGLVVRECLSQAASPAGEARAGSPRERQGAGEHSDSPLQRRTRLRQGSCLGLLIASGLGFRRERSLIRGDGSSRRGRPFIKSGGGMAGLWGWRRCAAIREPRYRQECRR